MAKNKHPVNNPYPDWVVLVELMEVTKFLVSYDRHSNKLVLNDDLAMSFNYPTQSEANLVRDKIYKANPCFAVLVRPKFNGCLL